MTRLVAIPEMLWVIIVPLVLNLLVPILRRRRGALVITGPLAVLAILAAGGCDQTNTAPREPQADELRYQGGTFAHWQQSLVDPAVRWAGVRAPLGSDVVPVLAQAPRDPTTDTTDVGQLLSPAACAAIWTTPRDDVVSWPDVGEAIRVLPGQWVRMPQTPGGHIYVLPSCEVAAMLVYLSNEAERPVTLMVNDRSVPWQMVRPLAKRLELSSTPCRPGCEVLDEEGERMFTVMSVDLDADGQPEYLAEAVGGYTGQAPPMRVLMRQSKGRWVPLIVLDGSLTIEPTATAGMRDIGIGFKHYIRYDVAGGERPLPNQLIKLRLTWDGQAYRLVGSVTTESYLRQSTPYSASRQMAGGARPEAGPGTSLAVPGLDDAYRAKIHEWATRALAGKTLTLGPTQRQMVVSFDIRRNGGIVNVHVFEGSGAPAIDETVAAALREAGPLPPLPQDAPFDFVSVQLPIVLVGAPPAGDPPARLETPKGVSAAGSPSEPQSPKGRTRLTKVVLTLGELSDFYSGRVGTWATKLASAVVETAKRYPDATLLCMSVQSWAENRTDKYGNPLGTQEVHEFWALVGSLDEARRFRSGEFYRRSLDFTLSAAEWLAWSQRSLYVSECGGLPPKEWER
jgi:TonB family protein